VSRNLENIEPSLGSPHLVILGAGASKAALPKGDVNGHEIPLLNELANTLEFDGLLDEE